LRLLEDLHDALATVDLRLRFGIQIRAELREGGQFPKLRKLALELPGDCFIALICAAEPTRDTEMPTLIAGLIPALNNSCSR
jgi:hypothetical protein